MRFVGLTAGLVKPNTLTWNGSSRNAPDTPAGAVRADTKKATSRGNSGLSSVPGPGKYIQHSGLYRNLADQQRSIGSIYPTAERALPGNPYSPHRKPYALGSRLWPCRCYMHLL